jgi:hypothetical protein
VRQKLAAGRGRGDQPDTVVHSVIVLVDMPEDRGAHAARRSGAGEEFAAVVEADRIQPFAVHRHGRMMQADQNVRGAAGRYRFFHALQFPLRDLAARAPRAAAVDAGDQPVAGLERSAIRERRVRQPLAHEAAHIVIARHAQDRNAERG